MRALPGPLVPPAWLARHLGAAGLVVLDASWYLPAAQRDARAEFLAAHLPGARFFDLDAACDPVAPLPHTVPAAAHFQAVARGLGVRADDVIVAYDGSGTNLGAARCRWMFRAFGHQAVAVLDGGLGAWRAAGLPLEAGEPAPPPLGDFVAEFRPAMVRDAEQVRARLARGEAQLVDVRSAERFRGEVPEPRAGVRPGHVPGARNVPYASLVAPDGTLLPPDRLRAVLEGAGVDPARPVIASCGSGVSACALLLALETLGVTDAALYDGSWTEWGGRADTPVETGPAR